VLDKLTKLSTKIGAPEEWRSYSGLVIKPDDLMGNIRRAERFESDDRLERAQRPNPREWLMTPQTVNAYYSPAENEIVLPAAILQPPLFDADADAASNYGGIGAFIGHEIVHAFDAEPEFRARIRPLVDQFNAYSPMDGMRVNGELTLRENAGDLGGLSLAYKAYVMSLNGQPPPVVDGTGGQRFFMGWARIWRAKVRDEYLRQWLLSVAHAPPQYRANGTVGNLPAFYEAFQVQPGDKLYRDPSQRLTIW
jgi:predicted metalloendopeptidase